MPNDNQPTQFPSSLFISTTHDNFVSRRLRRRRRRLRFKKISGNTEPQIETNEYVLITYITKTLFTIGDIIKDHNRPLESMPPSMIQYRTV